MTRRTDWYVGAVAVVLAVGYLVLAPHSGDLAAQTARADLFRRSGFVPYWSGWYSGQPTVDYSLVTPPLLGWFGAVGLGALSILGTAVVVVPLLRTSQRATAGAIAFVICATLDVISGRTTFAVGMVVALGAVLAAERRRPILAGVLAALATATSPVAGVLLLVVAAALLVADPGRRRAAAGQVVGVAGVLGVLAYLSRGSGGGGFQPYSTSSMIFSVATVLVVLVSPVGRRVRVGALVAIVLLVGVYFVHSPIGSNATRIAVLGAAPVFVAASVRRPLFIVGVILTAVLPGLQLQSDLARSGVPDHSRAFVAPLLTELSRTHALPDHRVELVDTVTHWPTTYLVVDADLARGWERQTDESRNPMFYGRAPLTAATYREFLAQNAVGLVAEPIGVPIDFGAKREARLIDTGLPYLRLVWSDPHWRLYSVAAPTPIVSAPATVTARGDTGVTIEAPRAGAYAVRLSWSPYLVVDGGTVSRGPDGQTTVRLDSAGAHRLHAVWRFP